MSQVVIIGAGPTGLTLGLLLARQGIAVQVVEASRSFRRIFRGEALMPSGLEAIDVMGLTAVIDRIPHRAIDAWEFYIENRLIFRVDEPMEAGGRPCTLVSQPALLEAVLEEANAYENFELIQGSAVQDLVWADGRVSGVTLGNGRSIAADLVIGADGRNSIVRQRANLALNRDAQSFDILWFKLLTSPDFTDPKFAENIFCSILRDRNGFGVFQSSEGHLQVGWSLHSDQPMDWQQMDWQQMDWAETLAAVSPEWLASYFRSQKEAIDRPLLLSVVVGRCPQWSVPGLLLLGDAAHPMSPIRAQGINMALRDVVIAANYLVSLFKQQQQSEQQPDQQANRLAAIDAILPKIQADREPEIIQIQTLQQAEIAQGELMRNLPILRHAVSYLAPVIGSLIRHSWLDRQLRLRKGCVQL